MQKEAKARIKINKLIEQSGWRLIDTSEGSANVKLEGSVKLEDLGVAKTGNETESKIGAQEALQGEVFETTPQAFCVKIAD